MNAGFVVGAFLSSTFETFPSKIKPKMRFFKLNKRDFRMKLSTENLTTYQTNQLFAIYSYQSTETRSS